MTGPGWFPLALSDRLLEANATDGPGGVLELNGASGLAYAAFGVRGFDGDNGPTSAVIDVESASGEFFIAFSDYQNGRWVHTGPFTGSVEAEIPNTGDYVSPAAFVSEFNTCYVAVIVPAGSALTVQRINLGVHGGMLGPSTPGGMTVEGGDSAILVSWIASEDAPDPDFAGYMLERAPLLYGSYTPVSSSSLADQYYLDHGVVEGNLYRYRVASVDVSGNCSMYVTRSGGLVPGAQLDPVAILDLSPGPLLGPLEATLDLSRSFDPEGGTIDTYEIYSYGLGPLSGPTDHYDLTLQPGCYVIRAVVKVGPRTGDTSRVLKVYPQWKDQPVPVLPSSGDLPRLSYTRSGYLPSGEILHFGFDFSIPSIAVWRPGAAGNNLLPATSFGETPEFITEPVAFGDSLCVAVVMGDYSGVYTFNEQGARLTLGEGSSEPFTALLRLEGEEIGLVFPVESGGVTDIVFTSSGSGGTEIVVNNVFAPLTGLDAVYNPDTGAVDIIFGDAAQTQWRRHMPGVGVLDSAVIAPNPLMQVDLELDPSTGRPAMVHYLTTVPPTARYQALNADNATWSAAQDVDSSDLNLYPGDLVVNESGTYLLNGLDNAGNPVYMLYELEGSTWSIRSTYSVPFLAKRNVTLLVDPVSEDAHVTGQDASGAITQVLFPADGSPASVEWTESGVRGQGRELHGAAGADGLHVVYNDFEPGLTYHVSSTTGDTWVDQGTPFGGVTDLDLGSTSEGEVYFSFIDVNSAELHYWNGSSWAMQQGYPTMAGYRPCLSDQPLQDVIHWAVYIQPTGNLRFALGSQAQPFTFNAVAPTQSPVWDGTINNSGYLSSGDYIEVFALAGGTSPNGGDWGFFGLNNGDFKFEINTSGFAGDPQLWGRTVDSCVYESKAGTIRAYWIALGGIAGDSLILEEGDRSWPRTVFVTHDYDLGILYTEDFRRTVSMSHTWGGTALALECDFFGHDAVFQWSNYGDWERLPMPAGLRPGDGGYMSKAELIIGTDGRWHIVYHDYLTDAIMVRSTL
jgi:hypothetical protein